MHKVWWIALLLLIVGVEDAAAERLYSPNLRQNGGRRSRPAAKRSAGMAHPTASSTVKARAKSC